MHKTIVNAMLLPLFVTLIVAGCAKPQANDATIGANPAPSPATAPSAPAAEPVVEKPPTQAATPAIALEQVRFAYDQATLSTQARDTLSANAAVLQSAPELKVRIEGHCDERGSDEYNLALGERRAQSVKAFLVSFGIEPQRLTTISYGEEMPLDTANNEMAWAKNRRAEFRLLN